MQIKWSNVIVLVLAAFALVIGLRNLPAIGAFLSTVSHIGPRGDPEQRIFGLMSFGLIMVTIVAVVRILVNNK